MSTEEKDVDMPTTTRTKTPVRMPCAAWMFGEDGKREYCRLYMPSSGSTGHEEPHSKDGIDRAEYEQRLAAWRDARK